jgi:hypothetical protein
MTIEKTTKFFSLCYFLKSIQNKHLLWSRSRIALRLRLHRNDAAPCGSGSTTLFLTMSANKFREPLNIRNEHLIN